MVVTTSKGPMLDLFGPLKIKFSGEKRVLCQVSASCLENMSYRVCYTFMSFSKVITKKPWCGLLRGWIHHFPPLRIRWCLVHHHPMVGTWTSGSTCWKSCASSPKNSGIQGIHFSIFYRHLPHFITATRSLDIVILSKFQRITFHIHFMSPIWQSLEIRLHTQKSHFFRLDNHLEAFFGCITEVTTWHIADLNGLHGQWRQSFRILSTNVVTGWNCRETNGREHCWCPKCGLKCSYHSQGPDLKRFLGWDFPY